MEQITKGRKLSESTAKEPSSIFKEILSFPFGSLPKSELEHLIFKHLVSEGVIKLEDGIFALAMQLRASPSKIRNLVFTHDQRLSANQYLSDSEGELGLPLDLEEILRSTRYELKDDFHIAFAVENPLQKMKIERLVRRTGFLADGSFSKEVIVLGNKAFVSLLEQFDLLKDKKNQIKYLYRSFSRESESFVQSDAKNNQRLTRSIEASGFANDGGYGLCSGSSNNKAGWVPLKPIIHTCNDHSKVAVKLTPSLDSLLIFPIRVLWPRGVS